MPFGYSHRFLTQLAHSAVFSFFRSIEVHGLENIPQDEPIILLISAVLHLSFVC